MSEQRVPYLVPRESIPRRRRQPTPRPIKLLTPAEVATLLLVIAYSLKLIHGKQT